MCRSSRIPHPRSLTQSLYAQCLEKRQAFAALHGHLRPLSLFLPGCPTCIVIAIPYRCSDGIAASEIPLAKVANWNLSRRDVSRHLWQLLYLPPWRSPIPLIEGVLSKQWNAHACSQRQAVSEHQVWAKPILSACTRRLQTVWRRISVIYPRAQSLPLTQHIHAPWLPRILYRHSRAGVSFSNRTPVRDELLAVAYPEAVL